MDKLNHKFGDTLVFLSPMKRVKPTSMSKPNIALPMLK